MQGTSSAGDEGTVAATKAQPHVHRAAETTVSQRSKWRCAGTEYHILQALSIARYKANFKSAALACERVR